MWTNDTFEAEPYGPRGMYFYEPLPTTAPETALPYCCYIGTTIFYEGEIGGREIDCIRSQWDLLGQRWTDKDLGWAAVAPFVKHQGQLYELASGQVVWRNGQWFKQWLAWRVTTDDRRWKFINERENDEQTAEV